MKKVRSFPHPAPHLETLSNIHSELYVFCDASHGSTQFRVEPNGGFDCKVERLAGNLAVQCLVRGQVPEDFKVFVPADDVLVEQLMSRARKLLVEGRANSNSVALSPRQKEILQSIIGNKANKEIASILNISVRTVKFHISTLLEKFGVSNRNELARKAVGLMSVPIREGAISTQQVPSHEERQEVVRPVAVGERLHVPDRRRSIRFPSRTFSA
jgi:DNA-binding CsgD family transcriptional regulator